MDRTMGILLSDDLLFSSRIMGTACALGLEVRMVRTAAELEKMASTSSASCVIIDLTLVPEISTLVARVRAGTVSSFIVAFGPHVDAELLRAARAVGCDVVLPRSKFVEQLPVELANWMGAMDNPAEYLTREQAREVDRRAIEEFGIPGIVLMENAGRGAAELLISLGVRGPVAICCGKGNNGGDGFVIARHLQNAGISVRVYLFVPAADLSGDAASNFRIIDHLRIPLSVIATPAEPELIKELATVEWVVDALFGTGLRGAVGAPLDMVIRAINTANHPVLAVDIPSGLDCDTGEASGEVVRATHTATFVAAKAGFKNPQSALWTGKVHVIGIGIRLPQA